MSTKDREGMSAEKAKQLKDKTGVSRAYKIATENPTLLTVAALQDAWIRTTEGWLKSLEASKSTDIEALKALAKLRRWAERVERDCEKEDADTVEIPLSDFHDLIRLTKNLSTPTDSKAGQEAVTG